MNIWVGWSWIKKWNVSAWGLGVKLDSPWFFIYNPFESFSGCLLSIKVQGHLPGRLQYKASWQQCDIFCRRDILTIHQRLHKSHPVSCLLLSSGWPIDPFCLDSKADCKISAAHQIKLFIHLSMLLHTLSLDVLHYLEPVFGLSIVGGFTGGFMVMNPLPV